MGSCMQTDDRLIYLLTKAQHKLTTYLKKALSARGIRVTSVQAGILFLLKRRPHTMTELSRELEIDNSAITGLADRLEKSGYVKRAVNPTDRRTFLVSITEKGSEEIDRAKNIIKEVNSEIKSGFSEEELEVFKRILNSFFIKFDSKSTKN